METSEWSADDPDTPRGVPSLLDPVFSNLSMDLIFEILTHLPFYQIYRLRTVCKAWNTRLCGRAFQQAWSATPHAEWVVMVRMPPRLEHPGELVAYDPAAGRWMPLQHLLDSCPPTASTALNAEPTRPVFVANTFLFPLEAPTSSLICFLKCQTGTSTSSRRNRRAHVDSLLVLNLLNGSHRILPPLLPEKCEGFLCDKVKWSDWQTFMQLLPDNAYRVFLYAGPYRPLEIFDSSTGSWEANGQQIERFCDEQQLESIQLEQIESAEDINDADLVLLRRTTQSVYAYNVKLDKWRELAVENFITHDFGLLTLVRHEGRVFVAGMPYVRVFHRGFVVWELHFQPHAEWVKVAETPPQYWRESYHIGRNPIEEFEARTARPRTVAQSWKRLNCPDFGAFKLIQNSESTWRIMSSGPLICLTPAIYNTTLENVCNYLPLVYNVVSDSWFQLPSYKGGNRFTPAFSLRPSFVPQA